MNDTPQDSEYLRRPDAQGHLKIMELLRNWDPIGVLGPDSDCPQDEYDMYSPRIVRMLDSGISERMLYKHLKSIVTDRMGMMCNRRRTKQIAKEMIEYWETWRPNQGMDPTR